MPIKLKRSSVAAKVPTTAQVDLGELALNTFDGKLYTKKDNGTAAIVEIGGVSSVAGKTGAVTLVKGDVGLGNVDNTSDVNKPVATATQTALDTKANLASPALTGTPTAPTAAANTNTTQVATTAYVQSELNAGDLRWNGASYTVSTAAPSGGVDGDFWFERQA